MRHAIGFTNQVSAIIGALPETHILGTIWGLAMMMVLQLMMWLKKYLVAELKKPGPHPRWMLPAKIASEMKEGLQSLTKILRFDFIEIDSNRFN